ncbi:MAG: transcription factor [Promethearchaeota archaeon]
MGGDIAIYVGLELLNSESKDITDEDITENIKESIKGTDIDFEPDDSEILKLNSVRKTLYKLYSEKLAQFRRIRDKSTGWFIYYWWHEFDLVEEILIEKKNLIDMKLRERLFFEENNYFFICKNCQDTKVKYIFDDAFDLNFRCPDCGNPLEAQDNQGIIEFLKNKIVLNRNFKISID